MEMITINYNANNVKKGSEIRELYLYAVNTNYLYTRFYMSIDTYDIYDLSFVFSENYEEEARTFAPSLQGQGVEGFN